MRYTTHNTPDPVTSVNYKRNILRTPAQYELRLQDERQKENVHLGTPHVSSQLNPGYNVLDDNPKELRSEGDE